MGEKLGLDHILELLKNNGLNDYSIEGLRMAASEGWIDPTKWSGRLISDSGDITHLSDRELKKLDEFLIYGKNVETDKMIELKQEAHIRSEEYSEKIGLHKGWELKLSLTEKASPRLGKELECIGIMRPKKHQAHHIIPYNQGKMAPILEKYGIRVDSAANGVFLPEAANKNWPGQVTHSSYDNSNMFRHGFNYTNYLQDRLCIIDDLCKTIEEKRENVLSLLEETRTYLLTGELHFLYQDHESFFKKKS